MMNAQVFRFPSQVYFDELDALGVLHHTRYLLHLERAQQAFFQFLLGVSDFNAERDEDIYVVVRGIEARWRQPVREPGPIEVAYTVDRIRAGGLTLGFRILAPGDAVCFCEGTRTVCKLSGRTHRPTPWSAPFRAALEAFASSRD